LAAGESVESIARKIGDPVLLPIAPARAGKAGAALGGTIIHIDHFGNATTNVGAEQIEGKPCYVGVAGVDIGRVRRTYGDVPPGRPVALIGSSGLLEIAIRDASAASDLGLKAGDVVTIR
jgi:hypothetical protein